MGSEIWVLHQCTSLTPVQCRAGTDDKQKQGNGVEGAGVVQKVDSLLSVHHGMIDIEDSGHVLLKDQ